MKVIDYVEYFSTKETAEYLQLTKQTIQNYVRAGKLPKRKIGNEYYFTIEEVKSLIQLPADSNDNQKG